MKNLLKLLLVICLISSCSPKYTASFQNYNRNNPQIVAGINDREKIKILESQKTQSNVALASISSLPIVIDSNSEIPSLSLLESSTPTAKKSYLDEKLRKELNKNKIALKASIKEYKNEKKDGKGNAKKNGWAIAGFVSSLLGLLVWSLWPFLGIFGIIASALGLKSERRGLAKAGLIMGIVGVAIILVLAILAVGAFASAV